MTERRVRTGSGVAAIPRAIGHAGAEGRHGAVVYR